ncbi:acyloxyacyl hydrolase [Aeromonas hydrophila]|uniref:acyloxyacyl hydrolase n=1 Tax=Aeromonas hydrophila TaxID=644 RepID=UPI001F6243E9|nr:acyloxyacyl hydrolase [Aeromonas hydrophila]UNU30183.1 acyloxyacyl hydrolase [Aeromonas hydrophila]
MNANMLLLAGALATLSAGTNVAAGDDIMALQLGKPAENEKLDIYSVDVKYHHMFWRWGDTGCQLGLGARGGMLKVGDDNTARLGTGARAECLWGNWVVWIPVEVLWLAEHEFGHRGNGFKDYGGPFQFSSGIGLGYALTSNWLIGYQYEHMSNANMYEQNPGLDSHSIHIEYRF